ncbi:MAG: hypothetical protein EOP41_04475 [Sphingobacteriaceae bacterium]|nr:MAG: hypothetical protein EOP41_04475 [Sphingobacteriaceae bacterium]
MMNKLRAKIAQWPYVLVSVFAAVSAFGTYTSMYAFRKAFAAATFTGQHYFQVDYKVWLVIAQVIGYMCSKFYGIRFIAEVNPQNRARYILMLIGVAWAALFCFAFVPAPWNIVFLFINGFPNQINVNQTLQCSHQYLIDSLIIHNMYFELLSNSHHFCV